MFFFRPLRYFRHSWNFIQISKCVTYTHTHIYIKLIDRGERGGGSDYRLSFIASHANWSETRWPRTALGITRGEIIDNLINIRVIVRRRAPIINAQLDASIDTTGAICNTCRSINNTVTGAIDTSLIHRKPDFQSRLTRSMIVLHSKGRPRFELSFNSKIDFNNRFK